MKIIFKFSLVKLHFQETVGSSNVLPIGNHNLTDGWWKIGETNEFQSLVLKSGLTHICRCFYFNSRYKQVE